MGPEPGGTGLEFDPLSLFANASMPMFVLSLLLLLAAVLAWFIIVLKVRQLRRWTRNEARFRQALRSGMQGEALRLQLASHEACLGARLLAEVIDEGSEHDGPAAALEHAVAREQREVLSLMTTLSTIGSAAPLAGLFGTVYGIMEAFSRIGRDKTVALPVIAPAIGDALITTALGLLAAIPAVIAFNLLTRRLEDLLDESSSFVRAWAGRLDHGLPWRKG